MMVITGRHYATGEVVDVEVSDGRIAAIRPSTTADTAYIVPGFVDLQINGYQGRDFNDRQLTVEVVAEISRAMDRDGVTTYLPTLTTQSEELLTHALATLGEAIDDHPDVTRRTAGIHLEGPYISIEDGPRGAHPRIHCRPPCWDEFRRLQDAARSHIRLLTLSPEYEGSDEFIGRVVESGVTVSIGHTNATSEQIRSAADAGATLSTHLGNAAHGRIRRHPNYIWDQLAEDRLCASLIADGHHLPHAVLKSFVRGKTPERCFLVSDITGMGGMPPGRYDHAGLGGSVEVLEDGRLVIAGQRQLLAGAALPMYHGIRNLMDAADLSFQEAIEMCSLRPARFLGLPENDLQVGAVADLVLLEAPHNEHVRIVKTFNAGEQVYSSDSAG